MTKKITEMTIKEVKDFYNSKKCNLHCHNSFCPLSLGGCCLTNFVDAKVGDFEIQNGFKLNDEMTVREFLHLVFDNEKRVVEI